jgi:CubicO group peptidase (beta-lactamase class C family)
LTVVSGLPMRNYIIIFFFFFTASGQLHSQSWVRQFEKTLQFHQQENGFEGLVTVSTGGKPLISWSNGTVHPDSTQQITPDSRFPLGTATQYITAMVTLQLVEEDRLSLQDTLSNLLSRLDLRGSKRITVRDLLTHTSGYPEESDIHYEKRNSPRIVIERTLEDHSKIKRPGVYRFSNINYLLLGLIIEEQMAQSWEDVVKEVLINELSLENTGFLSWNKKPENWVQSFYQSDSLGSTPHNHEHIENYFAAGSMYSNVNDLLKIERAILNQELADPSVFWKEQAVIAEGDQVSVLQFHQWPYSPSNPELTIRKSNWGGYQFIWITIPENDSSILMLSSHSKDLSTQISLTDTMLFSLIQLTVPCGDFHFSPCD